MRPASGRARIDYGARGTNGGREGKGSTVASRRQRRPGWPSAQARGAWTEDEALSPTRVIAS